MSTQLTIFPQNYQGYTSTFGVGTNQFMVDGINFSLIAAAPDVVLDTVGFGLSPQYSQMLFNNPFNINSWVTFRSDGGGPSGTPSFPITVGGSLILASAANWSWSGVYQRLGNLNVGGIYNVSVVVKASLTTIGNLKIRKILGSTSNSVSVLNAQLLPSPSANTYTTNFTASSVSDGIMVIFYGKNTGTIEVETISVTEAVISPTGVYTDLLDGQVICDLYQEEDIPLTLSVDDFKSVAEKVQSYSKDFDLPATKRNNQIFDNIFEVTRAVTGITFNPYTKSKCVLKQDGFILFEGYLRLINVKEKNGEISYNVNLYSEVIALADILKTRTFSDLDFSELQHPYNKNSIKQSWTGSLPVDPLPAGSFAGAAGATTTDVLKYPFIDWNHQWVLGGSGTGNAANTDLPELLTLEQAFRPCIKLSYLIDNIFAASPFTYTSSFLTSYEFKQLYMDFNWGSANNATEMAGGQAGGTSSAPIITAPLTYAVIPLHSFMYDSAMGFVPSLNRFVASFDAQTYTFEMPHLQWGLYSPGDTVSYRMAHYNSAGALLNTEWDTTVVETTPNSVPYQTKPSTVFVLNNGDYLQFEWESLAAKAVLSSIFFFVLLGFTGGFVVTSNVLLQRLRGELGQWEFLQGIMTMFNLVTMVDDENANNILIEPYGDIFIHNTRSNSTSDLSLSSRFNGKVHDWTEKVDASQMELTPLTEINRKTTFKFVEDDDDYIFSRFKQIENGRLYGSRVWEPFGFNILEGEAEVVAEPFAATVSKALEAQWTQFVTPSIYSRTDEGECEGFDNSPRIFFDNGKKDTGITYFIPEQNGFGSENQIEYLCFSHIDTIPSTSSSEDYVFQSLQLESNVGVAPISNLFNRFWMPYLNELYNADTRIMTLKVNLTPSDISLFQFFDVVMIKNRVFRVNKIDYKPNSLATVEFILIP